MSNFPFMDEPEERDLSDAIRRAAQKPLPKRFYKKAESVYEEGRYVLKLDGRTARTPARNALAVAEEKLGAALADEWNGQGEFIDPAGMPFSRMANSAIDAVADRREDVIDDLVRYAGTDLVFYRSEGPERLVQAQNASWNPIMDWCQRELGVRFSLAEGLIHVEQPADALAAVRAAIAGNASPFALAALHVMTTLAGSILIPLAHVGGFLDPGQAWNAAHVDELYQESVWGTDEEALFRRQAREKDFHAASSLFLMISAN